MEMLGRDSAPLRIDLQCINRIDKHGNTSRKHAKGIQITMYVGTQVDLILCLQIFQQMELLLIAMHWVSRITIVQVGSK